MTLFHLQKHFLGLDLFFFFFCMKLKVPFNMSITLKVSEYLGLSYFLLTFVEATDL